MISSYLGGIRGIIKNSFSPAKRQLYQYTNGFRSSTAASSTRGGRHKLLLVRRRTLVTSSSLSSSSSSSLFTSNAVIDADGEGATISDKNRMLSLRLYRMLLRCCKDSGMHDNDTDVVTSSNSSNINGINNDSSSINNNNNLILMQQAIEPSDWGHHEYYVDGNGTAIVEAKELLQLFIIWNTDQNKNKNDTISNSRNELSKMNDWYETIMMQCSSNYIEFIKAIPELVDDNNIIKTGICWTTSKELREAVRIAFRHSVSSLSTAVPSASASVSLSVKDLHGWSIRALQMIQHQMMVWKNQSSSTVSLSSSSPSSSITTTATVQGGSGAMVRVTATSQFLGTIAQMAGISSNTVLTPKYRFAYRIRVENISSSQQSNNNNVNSNNTTVQLLGRYWHITEEQEKEERTSSSLSSLLLDEKQEHEPESEPIIVDAPYTGAVGELPVLKPGDVFQYVSGTDLTTPNGKIYGYFNMAVVPKKTRSGKAGDMYPQAPTTNSTADKSKSNKETNDTDTDDDDDDDVDDDDDDDDDDDNNNTGTKTNLFRATVNPFYFTTK